MKPPALVVLILILAAGALLSQPVERPPRPGEPIKPLPRDRKPAVDRKYGKARKLRPDFGVFGGLFAMPSGSWGALRGGATYGRLGFGMELAYADFERDFVGSARSYVSPGESNVTEFGSFVRPSVYFEYSLRLGPVVLLPKASMGFCRIIARRYAESEPEDTSRYERYRLVNGWGLTAGTSAGPVFFGATIDWWVVNPWFYFYPEDYGMLAVGAFVGTNFEKIMDE